MTDLQIDELIASLSGAPTMPTLPRPVDVTEAVPPNPPEAIQVKFVGLSYVDAYREAASFVSVANDFAVKHAARAIAECERVIDFGSGWGRISRILLARTSVEHILALDVDLEMTALVNSSLPGLNALTIAPEPPTVLRDACADGAVAFSVFSHLSGPAHEAWASELGRLVAPGGFIAFTVLDEAFFGQVAGAQAAVAAGQADAFATSLAEVFPDLRAARRGFGSGEIQYAGVGGGEVRSGEYYGWAAAPKAYVERVWGAAGFRLVEWVPSGVLFQQALVFLVRESDARSDGPVVHRAGQRPAWRLGGLISGGRVRGGGPRRAGG